MQTLEEDPSYASLFGVAIDTVRDEIVLQTANRPSIRIYDRLERASPARVINQPKRVIEGAQTKIGNTGLYVDRKNGDIYSVSTDRRDVLVVHSRLAAGDVRPDRELKVPHRAFAIGETLSAGTVYRPSTRACGIRQSAKETAPLRL